MQPATRLSDDPAEPDRADGRPNVAARPVYLNPLRIKLPVTATVSLAHRVSGLLLLLALPGLLWVLHALLAGDEGHPSSRAAC